jgi:hypothetical protein
MFGSVILDIAIGMIFVFLMLSLVCSAINEIIEAYMNKRAYYLEQGIKDLLDDKDGSGFSKTLYEHPLVAALIQNRYSGKPLLPSYIPARNFALALMDIVSPAADTSKSGSTDATASQKTAAGTTTPVTSPPIESPPMTPDAVKSPIEDLRASIALIPNDHVRKALLPLIDAAGNDVAKARENIENWFNSAMDKVSGWYKRRTHIIILSVGFIVAAFLNADAISISNKLWHDKPMRDSIVAAAQESVKTDPTKISAEVKPAQDAFISECKKNGNKSGMCSQSCITNINSPECRLDNNLQRIEELGLPIGWKGSPLLIDIPEGQRLQRIWDWLMKLLGLIITAFAISLGAPFWFDLLNKFIIVRSTVKPREKSHEEESKE